MAYWRPRTLGRVSMVCRRPILQSSVDGGRTSLVQTTLLNAVTSGDQTRNVVYPEIKLESIFSCNSCST
jgi:hypothetical protein